MIKARKAILVLLLISLATAVAGPVRAARIKDIADVEGVRPNQMIGYGLVVGLNGTGDKNNTRFTVQSVINMLERLGVHINNSSLQVKNVAAVVVTADLTPFTRVGGRVDVLVSSIGDATSLTGGTLLLTPLLGVDGQVYAMAQGPLLVGGFAVGGASGSSAGKNHPTVGRIPSGGIVERETPYAINDKSEIQIALHTSDFITATRMVDQINKALNGDFARALDPGTLQLAAPKEYEGRIVDLVARIEQLPVRVDHAAKVVVDERTGTVVMGSNVRISTVAVAHGNISIQVQENQDVSQPMPFSEGETVVVPETEVKVSEEKKKLVVLDPGVTIASLVDAVNAIGATPRDLISILQSLKAAGALHAKLEII